MFGRSEQTNESRQEQRLLDVANTLRRQLDILDQDGWSIAAARLSSVIDAVDADLESLNSPDSGD
jgi:hypothetical protein